MTEFALRYIEATAAQAAVWGFIIVLVLMAIESSVIPLPSEVVMIPAGFLCARKEFQLGDPWVDFGLAILAGTVGSLVGAYANYGVSAWLGRPFLDKYGKYFFLPPPRLKLAEDAFLKYGASATFVGRLLPGLRHLISIPAGVSRMPHASFATWTLLGAGIWCTILTAVGYAIGKQTTDMTYRELVLTGTKLVKAHFLEMLAGCAVILIATFFIKNRGAKSVAPSSTENGAV